MVAGTIPRRLHQDGRAACNPGRFGILPFVTNHKRPIQVELPFESRLEEEDVENVQNNVDT